MKIRKENWKTEFSIGFKYSQTCVFIGLNLESTNIGLSSFYEGKIFNLLMQNSFYNTFKQSMKDFSSQIHQQLMSVVPEGHFYQWSLVCYSSFLQATTQVYPPKTEDPVQLTRLQERLLKKLGSNAYPFKFEVCFPLEILESNSLMFTIK